jgi:hypothetical protein
LRLRPALTDRPERGDNERMATPAGEIAPVSRTLLGDTGPWTWHIPTLWRALVDPAGPWQPPSRPWQQRLPVEQYFNDLIAYWAPLLTLTYGVLGWGRPEIGVQRWSDLGRPTDGAALQVLDRWWGEDALALAAWARAGGYIKNFAEMVADRTGTQVGPGLSADRRIAQDRWEGLNTGGDSFHLGHFIDHLFTDWTDWPAPDFEGRIFHDPRTGAHRDASLVLPRYAGWYAALIRSGNRLPPRPDERSWRVHLTAVPVGYLGAYRRSRLTGRWFQGRHRWHELGHVPC